MSGTIVFILVYAATAPLTPASFTSYWCMLAILHAKMIDMPLALATYRRGLAALGSFQSFLSQPSSWQPDITQAERRAAAALLEQGGAAGAASPEATRRSNVRHVAQHVHNTLRMVQFFLQTFDATGHTLPQRKRSPKRNFLTDR